MFDDGLHGDGNPGDGIYGAMIPANASGTGDMIRYYVTASDSQNHMSRWPLNAIANSPDYLGTVVDNLDSTSDLPRLNGSHKIRAPHRQGQEHAHLCFTRMSSMTTFLSV